MIRTHVAWNATFNDVLATMPCNFASWHYVKQFSGYKDFYLKNGGTNIFWPEKYEGLFNIEKDKSLYDTLSYEKAYSFEYYITQWNKLEEILHALIVLHPKDFFKMIDGVLQPLSKPVSGLEVLESLHAIALHMEIGTELTHKIIYPSFRVASALLYAKNISEHKANMVHEISGGSMYKYARKSYAEKLSEIWESIALVQPSISKDIDVKIYPIKFIEPYLDGSQGYESEILHLKNIRRELIKTQGWTNATFDLQKHISELLKSKRTVIDEVLDTPFQELRDRHVRIKNMKSSSTYG